ncbi:winged helix-turn-helix domain-containing protein [Micromonospora fluostatini]|uniref:winged helix-turn-helix domain-containing protein n=1 Tax=Micromonospora sp. JCM 30529 TaxID=3421643 RepID=UPI003D18519F
MSAVEDLLAEIEKDPKAWMSVPAPGRTPPFRPALITAGLARLFGVGPATVAQWRAASNNGRLPAGTPPFPEPDDKIRNVPYWFPERAQELLDWRASRPGSGAGGGRGARAARGARQGIPSDDQLLKVGLSALGSVAFSEGGSPVELWDMAKRVASSLVSAALAMCRDTPEWDRGVRAAESAATELLEHQWKENPDGWENTPELRQDVVRRTLHAALVAMGHSGFRPPPPQLGPRIARRDQIALDIKRKVASGQLRRGEQLPSLAALARQYGVSTVTVQAALTGLRGEGVVDPQHGVGFFVTRSRRRLTD